MRKLTASLLAAGVFIAATGIGSVHALKTVQWRQTQSQAGTIEFAGALATALNTRLTRVFQSLLALGLAVRDDSRGEAFVRQSAAILAAEPFIRGLLAASDGRIAQAYPPSLDSVLSEPLAQGYGAQTDPARPAPARIRSLRRAGERLLLIYQPLPVIGSPPRGGGWVGAVVSVAELVDFAPADTAAGGYDYQVLLENSAAGGSVIAGSVLALDAPLEYTIDLPDGRWRLLLAPRGGWPSHIQPAATALALVGILALLGAALVYQLAIRPEQARRELEQLRRRQRMLRQQLMQEAEQRAQIERQLNYFSSHDVLTGLPKRRYLLSQLQRALQRSRSKPNYRAAVLHINIGRFRRINDTLGYDLADKLLIEVCYRFQSCLGPQGLLARSGSGAEFTCLLLDIGTEQAALAVAERLRDSLKAPFVVAEQEIYLTASIGLTSYNTGYENAGELIREAEIAVSHAKSDDLSRIVRFDTGMEDESAKALQLRTELQHAIDREEFVLHYQPIVALADGRIAGFETLLRWQHPLEGLLPPGRFIELAEETELILPITRWIIAQACQQARSWRERLPQSLQDFYLSVNLSPIDLQPDLPDYITTKFEQARLPQGTLKFEVTENMIVDNTSAVSLLLTRLREKGFSLLLDDFGTGYSSLSYLHRFEFDVLKIDRSFVVRMQPDGYGESLVRAIINLARDMGMQTVAEGVENTAVLERLKALGCSHAQGYHFSPPLECEAAGALLAERRRW